MIVDVWVFLGSYIICRISKNKVVNFVFGSVMGLIVLGLLINLIVSSVDSYMDLHPEFVLFFGLGYFVLTFLTGYAIAKAMTE